MNAPPNPSSRPRLFGDDSPLLGGSVDLPRVPIEQQPPRRNRPADIAADSLLSNGFWVSAAEVPRSLPYLIKGICAKAEIVVLWGEPGIGKSFLVAEISCCVGANVSWRGRRVTGGSVLYVVGESSRAAIETRFAALKRERPEIADAKVVVLPMALNLLGGRDTDRLIAAALDVARSVGEVALIVVDTLATSFGGGDENSAGDVGRYLDNIKRIIDATGAAVLLVHHCGKNQAAGMRGSSALLGRLDAELEIVGKADSGRILRARKVRDRESNQDLFAFNLRVVDLGKDQDGDAITSCVVDVDERGTQRVREAISGKGGARPMGKHENAVLRVLSAADGRLSRKETRRKAIAAKVPRNRVYEAISNLIEKGLIVDEGGVLVAVDHGTAPDVRLSGA